MKPLVFLAKSSGAGISAPITEMPTSYTSIFVFAGVVMLVVVLLYSKVSFQQEATASIDTKVRTRINPMVPDHFLYSLTFLVGICVLWLGSFVVMESQAHAVLKSHVVGLEQVTDLTGPDALSLVESAVQGEELTVEVTVEQDGEGVPGRLYTSGNHVFLSVFNEETGEFESHPAARVA